jgi:pSer/pThr/pTyr-binding forkhead associated (FHA) protein
MEFTFAVFRAGEYLQTLVIDRRSFVIGRSTDCDVRLDSRSVSRQHCEMKLKRAGLTIKDLGSRNGTIVNGKVIVAGTRVLIRETDCIQIGKFSLRFEQAVAENSGSGSLESSRNGKPEQQALLASLEEFIRSQIDGDVPSEDESESDSVEPVGDGPRVPWTATKSTSNLSESIADAINDSTRLPEDSSATDETVTLAKNSDTVEDASELRRLEMRKRLDSMKAKDSKEAANRALKKLFGG